MAPARALALAALLVAGAAATSSAAPAAAGAERRGATVTRVATASPPVLRLGSQGARVRALQERLVALGYLPAGAADGVYGIRTWHAVVAFQGWQRLPRDGVVGRPVRRS